jgi:hypothetical protein
VSAEVADASLAPLADETDRAGTGSNSPLPKPARPPTPNATCGQLLIACTDSRRSLPRTTASTMPLTAMPVPTMAVMPSVVLPVTDAPVPVLERSPNHGRVPTAMPTSKWVFGPVQKWLPVTFNPVKPDGVGES